MSVVDIPVEISRAEVLRLLGYPAGRPPSGTVEPILQVVLEEARALVKARGAAVSVPLERAAELGLTPVPSEGLAIALVTIGAELEEQVARLSMTDSTRAVLLDAAGSAAAEEAADRLSHALLDRSGAAAEAADPVPCRLSPGYPGWALTSQRALFAVLPHRELGVELLPSLMMRPRKSVSFALFQGPQVRPAAGLSSCHSCGLERCRFRRRAIPRPTQPPAGGSP